MQVFLCALAFLFSCISPALSGETSLYLTSKEDVSSRFIEKIGREMKTIRMVSHRLSDPAIIQSFIEAHKKKVSVELIVDSVSLTKNTPLKRLVEEGIPVFIWQADKVPKKKSEALRRLKHSFCVFGVDKCWLGSYSFSLKRKYRPFESVLFLEDEKAAKALLEEFEEMKKEYTVPLFSFLKQRELR